MTYTTAGETGFIIDHTEVDDSLRGQNVGEAFLAGAVRYAREKGLKIYATCPFAIAKLKATPDLPTSSADDRVLYLVCDTRKSTNAPASHLGI